MLPFFRRKKRGKEVEPKQDPQIPDSSQVVAVKVVPSIREIPSDLSAGDAAYHAVQALGGLLMDRHSQCVSHWWCNALPEGYSRKFIMKVNTTRMVQPGQEKLETVIAAFLSTGTWSKKHPPTNEGEAIAWLQYKYEVPLDGLVIQLSTKPNAWYVRHAMLTNTTKGNHSAGEFDLARSSFKEVTDHPAWVSSLAPSYSPASKYEWGSQYEPRLHCLERPDRWLVSLVDLHGADGQTTVIAVAEVPKADNPNHPGLYSQADLGQCRSGELKDDLGYWVGPWPNRPGRRAYLNDIPRGTANQPLSVLAALFEGKFVDRISPWIPDYSGMTEGRVGMTDRRGG